MALYDRAPAQDRWVMEGNYLGCLPQRLARAIGITVLDVPILTRLFRYLQRSWCDPHRQGAPDGDSSRVRWAMLRHIAMIEPGKQTKLWKLVDAAALPKSVVPGSAAIDGFYRSERLQRPG